MCPFTLSSWVKLSQAARATIRVCIVSHVFAAFKSLEDKKRTEVPSGSAVLKLQFFIKHLPGLQCFPVPLMGLLQLQL